MFFESLCESLTSESFYSSEDRQQHVFLLRHLEFKLKKINVSCFQKIFPIHLFTFQILNFRICAYETIKSILV